MKKFLILSFGICIASISTEAQFQKLTPVQRVSKSTVPVVVDNTRPVVLTNTVPAGNFSNPSNTIVLPDGYRVTTTIRQNPQNLPQNFGGVVRESVASSAQSTDASSTCTSETKTINANSSTFMNVNYNQQAIQIFPGAIYTFGDFFNGNFRSFENGRNPISISSDNLSNTSGAVFKDIQNPTANNIRAGIASIIQPFSTTSGSAGIQYRIFTTSNDADLSVKLSAGGGYAGFKASAGYTGDQSSKRYYLTIDAIKPMYTLMSSVPANGYFSDKSIEANNKNLMVIKSVTYGTRILANVEITINKRSDDINFKASFGADSGKGVSANFNAMFNYVKSTSSATSNVNVYVVGGPINITTFDKDKLQEQIMELLTRCNYQTAQPIAYSFADMNGNILGVETATDRFTTRSCVPKEATYKLTGATVQIQTGKDNKEQGSNASVYLFNSDNVIVFENTSNNTEFTNKNEVGLSPKGLADSYISKDAFTKNGGYIDIFFDPKQIFLGFDEWNINGVTVTLLFSDPTGVGGQEPHMIDFSNAKATLIKNQQRLRLSFDKNFSPTGSSMPGL